MPTLAVDDATSVSLFYLDSGPVVGSTTYTTLFLLHGHTFHSPIFSRILALAPSYSLRIVAITRRDYPGSTPFTTEELRVAQHGDAEEKLAFLKQRAVEILNFMATFVREQATPKRTKDGRGGAALCGWSLGNIQGLACMAFAKEIESSKMLEDWLKAYIIYESSLGYAPPSSRPWYHPFYDSSISASDVAAIFITWITSYFKHPDITTLQLGDRSSPHRQPSESTFTEADRASFVDHAAGPRSEDPFFKVDPSVMQLVRQAAISPQEKVVWPEVSVNMILGDETAWGIIYGANQLSTEMDDWRKEDRHIRRFEKRVLTGGNHFAHWDEPNKLLTLFAQILVPRD